VASCRHLGLLKLLLQRRHRFRSCRFLNNDLLFLLLFVLDHHYLTFGYLDVLGLGAAFDVEFGPICILQNLSCFLVDVVKVFVFIIIQNVNQLL
jgi:hypothetical protein